VGARRGGNANTFLLEAAGARDLATSEGAGVVGGLADGDAAGRRGRLATIGITGTLSVGRRAKPPVSLFAGHGAGKVADGRYHQNTARCRCAGSIRSNLRHSTWLSSITTFPPAGMATLRCAVRAVQPSRL